MTTSDQNLQDDGSSSDGEHISNFHEHLWWVAVVVLTVLILFVVASVLGAFFVH